MKPYHQQHEEVLVSRGHIVALSSTFIESLKKRASKNARKRIRLCTHKHTTDTVHEMFIVQMKHNYIRPHKHHHKSESLHIIEGTAEIMFFSDTGKVKNTITMGDGVSGRTFYYRIDKPIYHTMVITSEYLVYHEVTRGPFNPSDTIFAPWSPPESDHVAAQKFLASL